MSSGVAVKWMRKLLHDIETLSDETGADFDACIYRGTEDPEKKTGYVRLGDYQLHLFENEDYNHIRVNYRPFGGDPEMGRKEWADDVQPDMIGSFCEPPKKKEP